MLIVVAIMGVIALATVPVAEITYIKIQETLLENNQAAIREAIMLWKRDCRNAVIAQISDGYAAILTVSDSKFYPPSLEVLVKPALSYPIHDRSGTEVAKFFPKPYLNAISGDPFVGAAEWVVHYASGTIPGTYSAGSTTLPADHVGVMDISCIADPATRRGFVTAIDGTEYKDW